MIFSTAISCVDHGLRSDVLTTTKLLQDFNSDTTQIFQQFLLDVLDISSNSKFLIFVLNKVYKSLSHDLILKLKNKAIELSQNQPTTQKLDIITNSINKTPLTVYQAAKLSYIDNISSLPGDVIDIIGSCLNKSESIHFGHLNKQLYSETQKVSYLVKRQNDEEFCLSEWNMERILLSTANGPE